jgi:NAD(P)H-dependent FMN reductase
MTLRLLAFAASLRRGSINRKLLQVAVATARAQGAEVDLAEFHEFDAASFNADLQESTGFPAGPEEFRRRLHAVDGMLLASPEYNFSIPGPLKNLIDWVSRMRPVPLRGKSALLLATSGGQVGGIRGLWQLRIPLEGLGVFVHPGMYTLPSGGQAFASDGSIQDQAARERLDQMVGGYLQAARALAGRMSG